MVLRNFNSELCRPILFSAKHCHLLGKIRVVVPARWLNHAARQHTPLRGTAHFNEEPTSEALGGPQEVQDIAVIGGGITGLSTAYYLQLKLPKSVNITLYEASHRLGGWLDSKAIDLKSGKVVFEAGPRTLRPSLNGRVTLDLIDRLGLGDQILATPKSAPAAKSRYIYYPDHLVEMPRALAKWSTIRQILREPIYSGVIGATISEMFIRRREERVTDESIGSFFTRHFGSSVTDNIVSAAAHGILAGDIHQLSMRSLLPGFWYLEDYKGSLIRGQLNLAQRREFFMNPIDIPFYTSAKNELRAQDSQVQAALMSSVYTLKGGLTTLTRSLESCLKSLPNVTIKTAEKVAGIRLQGTNDAAKVELDVRGLNKDGNSDSKTFDKVVATQPSSLLASQTGRSPLSRLLNHNPSVSVMVVNLIYENASLLRHRGFGYLLPQSLPFERNPELALGVIFDSESSTGQDTAPGTKITVILGGHWWNALQRLPDEAQGASLARAVLRRHLNIEDKPLAVRVRLQKDCIPQYLVGHGERMLQAGSALEERFKGKLLVAGSSYAGVGVNDCIRAGFDIAEGLLNGNIRNGLECYTSPWQPHHMSILEGWIR